MSRKKPKPAPPKLERREELMPVVAEPEPKDVATARDARYMDRAELRKRLREALG